MAVLTDQLAELLEKFPNEINDLEVQKEKKNTVKQPIF